MRPASLIRPNNSGTRKEDSLGTQGVDFDRDKIHVPREIRWKSMRAKERENHERFFAVLARHACRIVFNYSENARFALNCALRGVSRRKQDGTFASSSSAASLLGVSSICTDSRRRHVAPHPGNFPSFNPTCNIPAPIRGKRRYPRRR